jgi:GNAT superfamily N-acetyltransferase
MPISIKPATVRDVPVVLRMIRGLAEYEKLLDACSATETQLCESLFGPHPAAEVIIAWDGDEAVGFALFFHNYSTFLAQRGLYLEDLFVLPEWRGRGVGRLLLERLAQIAVERDCGRLEWTVLDWNRPAIGFYHRVGATPMADWTIYRLTGGSLRRLASRQP